MQKLTSFIGVPWGPAINHEWTITHDGDIPDLDNFFNSGSEIRVSATSAPDDTEIYSYQDMELAEMLTNMGMIIFNNTSTQSTGIGIGTNIGYSTLTTSYQTIFTVDSAISTGVYNYGNVSYILSAKIDNNIIYMKAVITTEDIQDATLNITNIVSDRRQLSVDPLVYSTIHDL